MKSHNLLFAYISALLLLYPVPLHGYKSVSLKSPPIWQIQGPSGDPRLREHLYSGITSHHHGRRLLTVPDSKYEHGHPTGSFESIHSVELLTSHSHIFATVICDDSMEPGVNVLHEGLLQVGHREPLLILASAIVTDAVRTRLARLPLVHMFRADEDHSAYCGLASDRMPNPCAHLKLLLFGLVDAGKVVFLEHDVAILKSLTPLLEMPAFTAVREPHVGFFETSVMVISPDRKVYRLLREEFCHRLENSEDDVSDHTVIRNVVPDDAWTQASDTYNVPQEHMDTLWYRKVDKVPAVIHYKGEAKPWNWWRLGSGQPISVDAFNRWCDVAERTEFRCGRPVENEMIPPMQPSGWSNKNRLTVMLSTWHRPTWKELTRHYASFKVVMQVVLIWHDPSGDPPLAAQLGLKAVVWQPNTDSLNNRFFGPGNLTECIYVADDDMKITEQQLIRGFQIWRGHSRRLVGYFSRKWMMESPYYSARIHDGYNIVLTKGLYTHRYFLYMYVHLLPKRIKDIVDKYKNCEDILLNMMVSGYSGVAPLHVLDEGMIIDMGHGGGISGRGSHFTTRFKCVKELSEEMGLVRAPMTIGSYSEKPLKNIERE